VAGVQATRVALAFAGLVGVVLRWWNLGGPRASFDEAFTGVYSHLPVGDILPALRRHDSHPPIDYLLRHSFGGIGDTLSLRVPSAAIATLTLLAVVWWMWDRGWFGVAVVAFTSLNTFELLYAHQARMYAMVVLAGTLAAIASERWLAGGEARWRWLAGMALVVALLDHSATLVLVPALLVVPLGRRDGAAWCWRATVIGAWVAWAVLWGPSFLEQLRHSPAAWIPFTSVSTVFTSVTGLVSLYPDLSVLIVAALALGLWFLRKQDRRLARVWVALFVVPFALAAVIGLWAHFLLPRTLAMAAWAPPVAFGALIERARRVSVPVVTLAVVAALLLVAPSVAPAINYADGASPATDLLALRVHPGDAVVVHPPWLSPMLEWNLGAPRHPDVPIELQGLDGYVYVVGGPPFDGRVWVLQPDTYAMATGDLQPCDAPTVRADVYLVSCYQIPDATARAARPGVSVVPPR
jgi:hypothetical protein